ncbi:MAG: hypothetical protein K5781_02130 [Nitrosopumilus sp.]|nr:hypothetical protein [Nitrosopumilus sp.]
MSKSFDNVKDWLLSSGLTITASNDENLGAVHAYIDEKNENYGFLYPEITGYFINSLKFLSKHDEDHVDLAKNSADWLIKLFENNGGIIQSLEQKLVYSFDTAICANGLLDCYDLTNDKKYLNYAQKLLNWISIDSLNSDGTLKPYFDLSTKKFSESKDVWYKQKGCLHVKCCIPFFHYYRITKNDDFLELGIQIANSINKFTNDDGSIRLHLDQKIIHLHSFCYALEGLIHAYDVTRDEKYLSICTKGIDWCISKIEEDGSILLWYLSKYPNAKTSYHIAQLIRILILIQKLNKIEYPFPIEKLFDYLIQLQSDNSSKMYFGGFYEENYKSFLGWKKRERLNSWGSMFALQAIYWKENLSKITFDNEASLLF